MKRKSKAIINFSPLEESFSKRAEEKSLNLIRQYPVGKYKLDFAYIAKLGEETIFKVAIEIDGSKYHTTTEQLNNDYKRERFLLLDDWVIVRFTGSEVYNHCRKCLTELEEIIKHLERKYFLKKF